MDIGCSFQFCWFIGDVVCVNCLIEFCLIFILFYKDTYKYIQKQERDELFVKKWQMIFVSPINQSIYR
jgi:hypothetical protein